MPYSQQVERWRPIVAKYVPPELVDKVLYAINGESGGNPEAIGDGGSAIGLLQIHHGGSIKGRPSQEQLLDPEFNIKYAAEQLGMANGNFAAWGENNLYQGKPFGVFGNNPYPGSISNARASAGVAVSGAIGQSEEKEPYSLTGPGFKKNNVALGFKPPSPGIKTQKGSVAAQYSPTGDYATDTAAYWAAAQEAYSEYAKYKSSSDKVIFENEDSGMVMYYDPDDVNSDEDGMVLDPDGTAILQRAIMNERAIDRLLAAKKAGLIDTGEGAAAAYLSSAKEEAAAASADYEDYVKRVSDLIAIEDVPVQRAAAIGSVLKSLNESRRVNDRSPFLMQGHGYGTSGQPAKTDLQPIAASMRAALPGAAPSPRYIDQSKLGVQDVAPPPKIPGRAPDEIINEYISGMGGTSFTPQGASSKYPNPASMGPFQGPALPTVGAWQGPMPPSKNNTPSTLQEVIQALSQPGKGIKSLYSQMQNRIR